jgi:hypothetical protein
MTHPPVHHRPDLSTRQGRAAYRRELLAVARKRRALGFVAIALGTLLVAWPRMGGPWMFGPLPTQTTGFALIVAGFALFGWVLAKRTRHHRRRMSAPHPPAPDAMPPDESPTA